ncbi:MAG: 23S rRNA (adenine(2503)-C(2))-methyltransferase RlmN [Ruminococcaceae bacterium]|nr:23S rRNA (adenine(2503)-C(2))-methyltransferase RlmN [Oscillospiraceae bacterium]
MIKRDIKSLPLQKLSDELSQMSLPSFRAKQIFEWLHKGVLSFDEMSNLSKELRSKLSEKYYISTVKISKKLVSKIDGTVKYLFELDDGECVESVVMKYEHGLSICISSQVGCKMGCRFCASTIGGFVRHLSAGELLNQVLFATLDLGERISNIVMMGIGEPLDNFENVCDFLDIVSCDKGINIGARHISLSTCGLVDKIYQLADMKKQITLSVSLHAPDDTTRDKIMPVNKKYNTDELLDACRYYIEKTNRRISFEYTLISGVNDSDNHAYSLAKRLKGMLCHINIINVNNVKEREYKSTSRKRVDSFVGILIKEGLNATVRRVLGSDINASCGQLRRDSAKNQ